MLYSQATCNSFNSYEQKSSIQLKKLMNAEEQAANTHPGKAVNLLDLPDVMLEHIWSFLSFDEMAKNRVVCQRFNHMSGYMLNKGFQAVGKYHNVKLREVKDRLPRRESERRIHPLARRADILMAVDTRLAMLSMTFSRFIESQQCCFIPGKVIDEVYRVLRYLDQHLEPARPHEILQELRDVSTMAVEHFDEMIAPKLRAREANHCMRIDIGQEATLSSRASRVVKSVKEHYGNLRSDCEEGSSSCTQEIQKLVSRARKQNRQIRELKTLVEEQTSQLENSTLSLNDLKRQNDEVSKKLNDLSGEVARLKEACIPGRVVIDRNVSEEFEGDNVSDEPNTKKRKIAD